MSCSKDNLDIDPKGQLLEASYFNNEDDVFMALISAYDPINWTYGWGTSTWMANNAASDDAHSGGDFKGDRPEWDEANYFNISVTNDGPTNLWRKYYAGIYRCNLLLENVASRPNLQTEKVNKYLAEAKFLRAYYYFDLVRFFGDVVLLDHVPGASEYGLTRTPYAEVYNFIVQDLKDAIPVLGTNAEMLGRVDKGAAMALLGKVYLFMSSPYWSLGNHYQDAADQFAEVINLQKYELMEDYDQIFRRANNFNKETIFELNYIESLGMDWDASNPYNRMEGSIDWQMCGLRKPVQAGDTVLFAEGWGAIKPTSELAQAFLSNNDVVRYRASMISKDSLASRGITYTDPYGDEGYVRMKYQIFQEDLPVESNAWNNNNRIIRLADVYLMLAECVVNGATDPTGKGADWYFNEVRTRVNMPTKSGITMDDIILERRLEFAFEGLRYWDVLRWNKGDEIFGNHKTDDPQYQWNPVKKGLWPIPQTEILRSGGSLVQNPGY
ncbi:MAG: RagB/SusD family nutrient uptake outer membrane protein [Bacteroidales bacterium]|nr:RagB/SusD family nutrient uptake outer membrane protein [Bacteroidales bacterium]